MKYEILGNTGLSVSRMCFGSLSISPLQANLSLAEGAAVIRYALERDVNFIDTAKLYNNYAYIKEALKGWTRPVVLAGKSYDYTAEGMKKSLEEMRLALDRDYIDIFMLHEQESAQTLAGHKAALEYLLEAKSQGLIKAAGVSTHAVNVIWASLDQEAIEVIHPIVNMQGLGLLDGTLPELLAALEAAYERGKGIYGMKALGGGNLIPQAYEALRFAFELPYLHSVAVGCKLKEEVDYNLSVLAGETPAESLSAQLQDVPRRLLIEEWCTGCGACVERCPFGLLEIRNGKTALKQDRCLLCGYCAAACPQFMIKVI
ncbi:MAG: aldo/keto reductase [Clostridia bacterium]|jgi:predicted aldo/keto reductase-like oxidoreductase|nr:aldo/keto reductase [Clostridia bacterium]